MFISLGRFANRKEMIAFNEEVRIKSLCAYKSSSRCDCKYGATNIAGTTEKGNGCPEMRVLQLIIETMTDSEWFSILSRLTKHKEVGNERKPD